MQGVDWGAIRGVLGFEPAYGPGDWFCIDHEQVVRPSGKRFANKQGGDGRRVVLATADGPNARLFARSASIRAGFDHAAHAHGCKVNLRGWIDFSLPVSVPSGAISQETFSCTEPDGAPLYAQLKRAISL